MNTATSTSSKRAFMRAVTENKLDLFYVSSSRSVFRNRDMHALLFSRTFFGKKRIATKSGAYAVLIRGILEDDVTRNFIAYQAECARIAGRRASDMARFRLYPHGGDEPGIATMVAFFNKEASNG